MRWSRCYWADAVRMTRRAREAVSWLRMHKHDGLANKVWKITGLEVKDPSHIVVSVWVPNPRHVELIRSQTLMRQSLIAKYACPPPTSYGGGDSEP